MRARLVIVEDRELTDVARDGDGQLAAGIDAPEQRVGDGIALLLAGVPCFEDRVGPCGNRRIARRAAVHQHRDDRLAERLERLEQVELLSAEIERSAVAEVARSEEHTSELQSLMRISYAVFCLK